MKKFFKLTLMTIMLSAGVSFSGESSCRHDDSIGCMICSFAKVAGNPGACMGSGSDCGNQIICGGGPQQ
ncbi:hypothetical protein [Aquiflexum sp.]|uniref:hypothetical protein n=1 Tax=Aquiflexum sp. TaxID=1872584 RepID=UPI0035933129